MKNLNKIAAAIALATTSCSGGGGGSSAPPVSPPPPPPPPPVNVAPVASVSANATTIDEGQTATLDASASSDADGDPLTFSWSQTAGTTASIAENNDTATITIPELAADQVLTFQVSVSDGTTSSTASVNINGSNIVLSPIRAAFDTPTATLTNLDAPQRPAQLPSMGLGSPQALSIISGSGTSSALSFFDPPTGGMFGSDKPTALVEDASGNVALAADSFTNSFEIALAVAFETEGIVRTFEQSFGDPAFNELDSFSLAGVCSIDALWSNQLASITDLVIGRRGSGIQVRLNNPNAGQPIGEAGQFDTPIDVTATGTFCHIASLNGQREFYAFNEDDGLVYGWEELTNETFSALPNIDFQIPTGLSLVDFIASGQNGDFQVFAALVTDGQHDGDHRVIIIHNQFDGSGAFTRLERTWTKGVPADLEIAPTGTIDLIAVLNTAPYLVVLENDNLSLNGDVEPEFSDVQYFEIGLGASEILGGTIVFSEKGIVEFERNQLLD